MNNILVIDDDELFLELLLELLNRTGWQAIGAENGRLGLQLAKEQMPDLIICDIRMKGFSGYQVLEALRQDSLTEKIPLIFLTATLTDIEYLFAKELGAKGCLDKFFTFDELFKVINTQISHRSCPLLSSTHIEG